MELDGVETRLAVYGTLGPGGPNEHRLAHLGGAWVAGTVRGHLRERGWGAAHGYPGYRRATTRVVTDDGPVAARIYELATDG
ncbi:MAG: hypothetical protein AAF081_11055 [Actinomycetota bacterium]